MDQVVLERKLHCFRLQYDPGGGINVAKTVKELGGEATAFWIADGLHGGRMNILLDTAGLSA